MKVFSDECVDRRLPRDIVGHYVKTASQMGWTTIKNGELLALAAERFDAFVTVDRNLSFQQISVPPQLQSLCFARNRTGSLILGHLCRTSSPLSRPPLAEQRNSLAPLTRPADLRALCRATRRRTTFVP